MAETFPSIVALEAEVTRDLIALEADACSRIPGAKSVMVDFGVQRQVSGEGLNCRWTVTASIVDPPTGFTKTDDTYEAALAGVIELVRAAREPWTVEDILRREG